MRFTVHDSLDYYKLKCSIFNDDKKTDLIGEAWIDLTGVVVPGGGQNDLWHQLQFKGKYAGDVRMELTYYDTRPKDGSVVEKRRDKEKSDQGRGNSSSNDGTGPRRFGPREVKRRPLPTDPCMPSPVVSPSPPEQVHSALPPQLHQNDSVHNMPQEYDEQWAPDSNYHAFTSAESTIYTEPLASDSFDHPLPPSEDDYRQPQGAIHSSLPHQLPSSYDNSDRPSELPDSDGFSSCPTQPSFPVTPAHLSHHSTFITEPRYGSQPSESPPSGSSPYPVPTPYGSSPPIFSREGSACGPGDQQYPATFRRYSTSPIKNDVFRDSPLRHSISQHDVEPTFPEQHDISEDEGSPPPPPAHRSNLQALASSPDTRQDMQPVQVPHPLNLISSNHRMSPFDRSPLQSIERNYDPDYHGSVQPIPPSAAKERTYSPYSKPTYSEATYSEPAYSTVAPRARVNSYHRPISGIENMPPSLRSGYGRGVEETEDSWMQNERYTPRKSPVHADPSQDQDMSIPDKGYSPYQLPRVEDEEQAFTSEPPFVKPQAVSPDPRIVPKRKAVSPLPFNNQGEQRLSGVPFGPDSYEVFNPSSPLSSSVAGPETRYENPEQAKEAARQHEVQKLRDQGPIIGNDGRVIDPTDHLPTDTWAPEPERKNRKPEMVIRYKTKDATPRTPQGYGSSPGLARPHSIAGSVYGSSPLAAESPVSLVQQNTGRNRLQKQMPGRPLPVQPYQQTHSSPAVPTVDYNTPSPRSSYSLRPDLAETPLYGQQNHRYSRGGSLGGFDGGPPPIPAKLPISHVSSNDGDAGYGGMDALSAELSTIDIGTGTSSRGGRTRRGYGQ